MPRAIGIDLGTTYTVVATLENGRPTVIPNALGQHLTPSVVAFTPDGTTLVGQAAKQQAAANPGRTVFSIKRSMGTDHRVRIDGEEYSPTEISSLILRRVKADAEAYLGEDIGRAVITVPAYFNDRQRQATREAGALAGLEVLRIFAEPTSTALAYGVQREAIQTVLVWDLGGGTFDVSILDLDTGIFEVRAVSGDSWLGGDDYDQRLATYLADEYERIWKTPFPRDPGLRRRLRDEAERAKIELSSSLMARVYLDIAGAMPLDIDVTRQEFERLTGDLLQSMVVPTKQALRDASLTPSQIDRVVLAGGATRMPGLRRLVKEMLGIEPYRYLDPDEVVAMGAAIQAGMLMGQLDKVVLLDVLPLSLGVETQGGLAARIIPRNSPLPATASRIFTTAADCQTCMDIHVIQGERELAQDNVSLGQFRLDGIEPAHRGQAKVEVTFEADVDGLVHVSAADLFAGQEVKGKFTATKLLDPSEIWRLTDEAERNAKSDREKREFVQSGIEAQNALAAAQMAMSGLSPGSETLQGLRMAVDSVQEAMGSGVPDPLKRQTEGLRHLLASVPKT